MMRDDVPDAAPPGAPSAQAGAAPDAGPADIDDAALVARCIGGDATAWAALVHRYQRLVHAIPLRAGLDEHAAADVFQTVFERLVEHLPRIADPSRLQAWIVTTTKREALLQLRRGRDTVSMARPPDEHGEVGERDVADESPIAEEAIAELQQLNRLRVAMERLDERSRALIRLLFRDDDEKLPYEEIARQLDMPVGSIGPMRARCLEKLRRLMRRA
ncbi:MAG TPA: sigma-70 family RNA polymerase sigma factor [Albitalea sp.]